ncbi:MAG: hypothetical protein QNJ15_06115 [Erythrobacter sp.]|nr:hypothetical protein [Erythrobacter sp.]
MRRTIVIEKSSFWQYVIASVIVPLLVAVIGLIQWPAILQSIISAWNEQYVVSTTAKTPERREPLTRLEVVEVSDDEFEIQSNPGQPVKNEMAETNLLVSVSVNADREKRTVAAFGYVEGVKIASAIAVDQNVPSVRSVSENSFVMFVPAGNEWRIDATTADRNYVRAWRTRILTEFTRRDLQSNDN